MRVRCGVRVRVRVWSEAPRYLQEPEVREEGGTPSIVGAIRQG